MKPWHQFNNIRNWGFNWKRRANQLMRWKAKTRASFQAQISLRLYPSTARISICWVLGIKKIIWRALPKAPEKMGMRLLSREVIAYAIFSSSICEYIRRMIVVSGRFQASSNSRVLEFEPTHWDVRFVNPWYNYHDLGPGSCGKVSVICASTENKHIKS